MSVPSAARSKANGVARENLPENAILVARSMGPAALLTAYRWIIDSRDEATGQRLDELELDVIRQAADVVVRLNIGGAVAAAGFDDVRVQGALDEVIDGGAGGGIVKHAGHGALEGADELRADSLALFLGVAHASELLQEGRTLVGGNQLGAGRGHEVRFNLLALAGFSGISSSSISSSVSRMRWHSDSMSAFALSAVLVVNLMTRRMRP